MTQSGAHPPAIYRFTRDLRLDDHAGLQAAGAAGAVLPVLVLDPHTIGPLRTSPRRAAFFCAAVAALAERLRRERGTTLIVRRGAPAAQLRALARASGARCVAWSVGYDAAAKKADRDLQSALEEAGVAAQLVHDAPAVAPDETAAAREDGGVGYRAFAPFYAVWRTFAARPAAAAVAFHPHAIESEPLPAPGEFGPDGEAPSAPEPVGEAAVRGRLEAFLAGPVLAYGIARNVPTAETTSRLAADLSFGTIAARTVVAAVGARAADPFLLAEERASLRLFARALAQRDFFLQLGWFYDEVVDAPLQAKMRGFTFARAHPALEAWRQGRTGYPLVDAGIRQLHATGWMHPRVRAVAASFLCFDLGVDWRVGRAEWDRYLTEDDPALSTGNWQWIAGVGADLAAYPRIYNPVKQARRFDPQGSYVRRWIRELAEVPGGAVFEPYHAEQRAQLTLPLFGDAAYPRPAVDHEVAARAFLARYRDLVS